MIGGTEDSDILEADWYSWQGNPNNWDDQLLIIIWYWYKNIRQNKCKIFE